MMKWNNIKANDLMKINKTTSMKMSFVLAMGACAFFAVFINLVTVGFSLETLMSAEFWGKIIAQNAPLLILSYLVFLYSVLKNELENQDLINIKKKIDDEYKGICDNGEMLVLDDYIEKYNTKQKLFAFKRDVHFKLAKEINQEKRKILKEQIQNADEEAQYADVRYYPVDIRLIFSHVENEITGNPYAGGKGKEATRLLLFKISGVLAFSAVITSFAFSILNDVTFAVIINAVMALFQVIATYVFSNMAGKEYVEGRELSAYQARFNFLMRFKSEKTLDKVQ